VRDDVLRHVQVDIGDHADRALAVRRGADRRKGEGSLRTSERPLVGRADDASAAALGARPGGQAAPDPWRSRENASMF
jgi:hypothetical protein